MAERWKPLPASAYKEDFRPRQPMLPGTYETTPARVHRHQSTPLPVSRVRFTNIGKVFWPQQSYSKAGVIAYYDTVADVLLPHLLGRPLIMERYPNGIA